MAQRDLAAVAPDWEALAAEVLVGIKDWRTAHPRATFTEIETALDRELSRLRTRLLEDVALASGATDTGKGGEAPSATCPTCGGTLRARGEAMRTVTVTHQQRVTLSRQYAVCATCGVGVSPPG